MSIFKKTSNGFALLPLLIIISLSSMILLALSQQMLTHLLFTAELQNYLKAEATLPIIIENLEIELPTLESNTPPQSQSSLIDTYLTWPSTTINHEIVHIYSQSIHQNLTNKTYSSLIAIGDQSAPGRLLYELISICTLAAGPCTPVQLTSMQIIKATS